jgi:hypothetical protein
MHEGELGVSVLGCWRWGECEEVYSEGCGEALAVFCYFLAAGEEDRVTRAEKVSSFFWMYMCSWYRVSFPSSI